MSLPHWGYWVCDCRFWVLLIFTNDGLSKCTDATQLSCDILDPSQFSVADQRAACIFYLGDSPTVWVRTFLSTVGAQWDRYGIPCFIVCCRYYVSYKLKVCGHPASSESVGAFFLTVFAYFMSLGCNLAIFVILRLFHYFICYSFL